MADVGREIGVFDDVVGAAFGLEIGFSEVFADNAEEEELNTADEHNNTDEARPAGNGIAEDEGFADDDDDDDESDEAEEDAEEGGESERDSGKGDDAFDGVFEEFPEGPVGLAGGAFDVFEFEPFGLKADEAPEAFRVAVVFVAFEDGVDHLAGHEAVIAGAVDHFDFAHFVNEFIENTGAEAADRGFAFTADAASGRGVVVGVLFEKIEHFGEEGRWVLKVGVHDSDVIAGGVFEASEEGGFFTEIARERDVADAAIAFCEIFDDFEGVVFAAVVDEEKFELVRGEGGESSGNFAVEKWQNGGFVVTWDNNADLLHGLIIA